jgi:hypothetical protein
MVSSFKAVMVSSLEKYTPGILLPGSTRFSFVPTQDQSTDSYLTYLLGGNTFQLQKV